MKLLKIPTHEDPYLNRIDSIARILLEDETGEYFDEMVVALINFCRQYPIDNHDIMRAEQKLEEARFWINEFFTSDEEIESNQTEEKEE